MISIKELSHEYRKENGRNIKTLEGISLDIPQGSFVSIIGHNGSGKSTLAKHLNGLILPQKGSVAVDGIPVADDDRIWEIRRKVGMVFQNPDNQFVGGTIEEDIAFGLENMGVPTKEMPGIILEAAGKVGMENELNRPPHRLSGGQKQRSAIGSVIAMKPDYLVLDEPTSMLDPRGRQEVVGVLRDLNRKDGITVILITHFMDEVVFGDRVLVMDQGKILLDGTPDQVFREKELLLKTGLELPHASMLQSLLKEKGIVLNREVLTKEDLVEALWELK